MATVFFQDIIEQIIFYLQHDKVSLSRIRLASRAWDTPCRALLFYKIEFKVLDPLDYMSADSDPHDNDRLEEATQDLLKRYNTFLALIHAQPSLGYVPKELVITRAHRLKPSIWGTLEPVYGTILRHLKHVQKIHLCEIYFSHFSKAFFEALLGICRQSTVTHSYVVNCPAEEGELLKEISLASKSLEHFEFSSITSGGPKDTHKLEYEEDLIVSGNSGDLSLLNGSRIRLKTLVLEFVSIGMFARYLLDSATGMNLSGLKELKLCYVDNSVPIHLDKVALAKILGACGSSLELLDISAPSGVCNLSEEELRECVDISRFPRLRGMSFSGIHFTRDQQNNKMSTLMLSLSSITQACKLRVVNIQTYIDSTKGDGLDWTYWRLIDDILSDQTLFPFLKTIAFSLIVNDMRYADTLVALLEQQLPIMLGRGFLSVSIAF